MRSQILHGHVLDMLATLPEESVQVCVTSPPYWGLRKYAGLPDYTWGGKPDCQHEWGEEGKSSSCIRNGVSGGIFDDGRVKELPVALNPSTGQFCRFCGAWRGQYGLEPTVSLYVQHTIEVLQAIRRVLRPDGVCFWNCGDSYAGSGKGICADGHGVGGEKQQTVRGSIGLPVQELNDGLKAKDLCLIPQRVALAAQSDGWWVRSDIIWNKPNPMPESVTDRPTDAYEHILLLTKSKDYYWDKWAVAERSDWDGESGNKNYRPASVQPDAGMNSGFKRRQEHASNELENFGAIPGPLAAPGNRNIRNVWTFTTGSFNGAHFAVFPEELPKRCILAATSEKGCCSVCGAPWVRIVKNNSVLSHEAVTAAKESDPESNTRRISLLRQAARAEGHEYSPSVETLGWEPTCACNTPVKPCVVIDPFAGSGTTGIVATKLGRESILIEASDDYIKLIQNRTAQEGML